MFAKGAETKEKKLHCLENLATEKFRASLNIEC